jgi:hypothetical protein
MVSPEEYVPLKWPDERLKQACGGWKASRAFREMDRLVQQRGPIPPELWGADPCSWRVAQQVASIVRRSISWTSDNFLPDDPVDILLWGGWYDLGEVEVIRGVERRFVIDIPEALAKKIFSEGLTLGQLVDHIIEGSPCLDAWPLAGDGRLEARTCPARAAFADLCRFIVGHCHAGPNRLRPSADLRNILPRSDWPRFDRFVQARFGVSGVVRRRFLGLMPPWIVWLVLSAVAIMVVGEAFRWIPAGWLLSSVVCVIGMGIVVARLSWLTWPRKSNTVRRVVEWVLDQRSRKRPGEV